ncbi:hypothetical protein P7K49_027712 [Saguinus oedipus]|uniref:Uncharacterized protein n=1 Tax=Saguinus oedipus TaxID=9490 RepID=A0ABQ9UA82_SAGOE|nr:hypothetical protein P7K49_027712 [Saguinus oedipus]
MALPVKSERRQGKAPAILQNSFSLLPAVMRPPLPQNLKVLELCSGQAARYSVQPQPLGSCCGCEGGQVACCEAAVSPGGRDSCESRWPARLPQSTCSATARTSLPGASVLHTVVPL